ncbi:MAG: glycerol-3-phosphate dehydrogenase/oxidase [Amaricoccus sp.]
MPDPAPEAGSFDVAIIGGGINGCGTFRDLCAQGVKCLLIERDDFAAGASSASSRLMHGGLKYLETGEFRLVRESLTERNMLLATAPHVVSALPCIVPVRSWTGGIAGSLARFLGIKAKLNDRGFAITALGLTLYDVYARNWRAMPTHRMLSTAALRREMPALDPAIIGAGLYYEGQISYAERLALELVLDGEALCPGSRALNHAELLPPEGDRIVWRQAGIVRRARVKAVINAGGAWIDKVNAALGIESRLMGGSKGSHLVIENPALHAALNGRMVYFGTADGRVNLAYPLLGRVLLGSTDIAVGDPDTAACDENEAAYLRRAVSEVFPGIPVTEDQIVYRFCGVRPLPRADGAEIGSVTRDHSIATLALPGSTVPVYCLIGGKWTTFRAFSEQAADRVLTQLGRTRQVSTVGLPIGGGRDFPREPAARTAMVAEFARLGGIAEARADTLLSRYGTRARGYCEALAGRGETLLTALPSHAREELVHLCRTERVGSLEDLLRRRTGIVLTGHASAAVVAEIADLLPRLAPGRREPVEA